MSTFIQITEVGPRDGFQNIKAFIPTDLKIKIIDRLVESGIGAMEITSMVSPKAIPQMRDAREVIQHVLNTHPHIIPSVLVPNVKGASLASEAGIQNINYVVSVSPAHNKANINRTHAESLEDLYKIRHTFPEMTITLSLATVFGCPFIGETSRETLMDMIKFADDLGISAVTLCDTIGVANPTQTLSVLRGIQQKFPKWTSVCICITPTVWRWPVCLLAFSWASRALRPLSVDWAGARLRQGLPVTPPPRMR